MIRFYYLPDEAEQTAPCVLCGTETKNRAGYNPPGIKVERAVCDSCYSQGSKLVRLVMKLVQMSDR